MFRTMTPRQLVFDLALASVCVFFRLTLGANPLIAVIVLAMGAALALRRFSPALALAVAWGGAIIQMASGLDPDPANLAVLPVLYATAAYGTTRVKWAGLVSAGAGAVLAALYISVYPLFRGNLLTSVTDGWAAELLYLIFLLGALLAAFGLSWTLGLLARTRRLARESRAAQRRAEQEQRQAQKLAIVEQERNRIARDMHDVVAHSLAVVIAQADGARYARAGDPAAVDNALTTISATAREALGDVRLLLGQLRHNQGEGPQPVLADLERLLEQMRAAGLTIAFEESGARVMLGTGQQLAVYRIVQEALTNALRHGDVGREVLVRLEWRPDTLEVTVDSALKQEEKPADAPLGHGLAGMRERAVLAGGWLTAEPFDRRFVVTAGVSLVASSRAGEHA